MLRETWQREHKSRCGTLVEALPLAFATTTASSVTAGATSSATANGRALGTAATAAAAAGQHEQTVAAIIGATILVEIVICGRVELASFILAEFCVLVALEALVMALRGA